MLSKNNLLLILAVFAFGCFIGNNFKNESDADQKQDQKQAQESSQGQNAQNDCQVDLIKKTHPDGSIDEFFRIRANSAMNQGQSLKQSHIQSQEIKTNDSKIEIFAGGGMNSDLKPLGSIGVSFGKHQIDFSKTLQNEGFLTYKVKILTF